MLKASLVCLWLASICWTAEASGLSPYAAGEVHARALGSRRRPAHARRPPAHRITRGRGSSRGGAQPHRSPAAPPATKTPTGGHRSPAPVPAPAPPAAVGRSIPALYQQLVANRGRCTYQLDTKPGGYSDGHGSGSGHYCGDSRTPSMVYWLSNLDVDCDGSSQDGPCANDPTHSAQTAFEYNGGYSDAQRVPYTVINTDEFFDPSQYGIQPFAVVGVYCAGKIVYSVYGDQNSYEAMGEGSLRLAQLCFGSGMTGGAGHDQDDVMYFAFTGPQGVDPFAGTNAAALAARGRSLLSSH